MSWRRYDQRDPTPDVSTVESRRNDLTAEEFPDGPYGSSIEPAKLGKSTPWRPEQRPPNTYTYENRELHAGLPRDYPGDHDLHDETDDEMK
ncbi:hypothetical protein [Cohnella zeiphila]|uniref:Cytosolic protein n=1 Tax=Cohnella zeiphila TaxID=2761120 RepID=A0A7X0SLY8_9BACL|nr:hypothetical protein [Cohnella zeiphila]MBB6731130.1 hypothetical protein [Cohnella zeiphila]